MWFISIFHGCHTENHQKRVLQGSILAFTAIAALITISASVSQKSPVHTSILTGKLWLSELYASLVHMYEQLGVRSYES